LEKDKYEFIQVVFDLGGRELMSTYFCPHLMFNSGYLIEFVYLKSDLIDNFDN